MNNSGETGGQAATPQFPAEELEAAHDGGVAGDVMPAVDVQAEPILGDTVIAADAAADLADLHAALASLSDDAFAYLDLALDHLTSSSDLFDAPAMDLGDIPDGDFSAS